MFKLLFKYFIYLGFILMAWIAAFTQAWKTWDWVELTSRDKNPYMFAFKCLFGSMWVVFYFAGAIAITYDVYTVW